MAIKTVYFAGGCFWCVVGSFDLFDGVKEVKSGYMGGSVDNPTYEDVKTQKSGHYEVVKVVYDDELVEFNTLMQSFWRQVDPTDDEGQFHDRGLSYRTGIFYTDDEQKMKALKSKKEMDDSGRFPGPILTKVMAASTFYIAEDYHQDYHKTHEEDYKDDRAKSGRDEFIKKVWGDDYWSIYE